ncbi:RNA recognition motif, partial [Rhizoctonia solani]
MAGDEDMRMRSVSRSRSRGRSRSRSQSRAKSRSRSRSPTTRTVFIKNLTRNIVQGHLRAVFSPYGDIRKIHMPTHQKSAGQTRGSAHVEFFDSRAAKTAVKHMHTGLLDGATLAVELSDPPRSPSPPRRPYSPPRRNRRPPSPIRNRRLPPPARRRTPPRRFGGAGGPILALGAALAADRTLAVGPGLVPFRRTHARQEVHPGPGAGLALAPAPVLVPTPARLRGPEAPAEAGQGLAPPLLQRTLDDNDSNKQIDPFIV